MKLLYLILFSSCDVFSGHLLVHLRHLDCLRHIRHAYVSSSSWLSFPFHLYYQACNKNLLLMYSEKYIKQKIKYKQLNNCKFPYCAVGWSPSSSSLGLCSSHSSCLCLFFFGFLQGSTSRGSSMTALSNLQQ